MQPPLDTLTCSQFALLKPARIFGILVTGLRCDVPPAHAFYNPPTDDTQL